MPVLIPRIAFSLVWPAFISTDSELLIQAPATLTICVVTGITDSYYISHSVLPWLPNSLHGPEPFRREESFRLSRYFPTFMDIECSLPASGLYPEPDESSPQTQYFYIRSVLVLSFHTRLRLPTGLLLSVFPTKTSYAFLISPIRAICSVHLNHLHLNTLIIYGEEYKLRSFSKLNFFTLLPSLFYIQIFL